MHTCDHHCRLVIIFLILASTTAFSQKTGNQGPPGAPQGSSASLSGQGGGQGLQGFSFAPEEWPELSLPDVSAINLWVSGRTVLCYKLTKSNSASQPFILQRIHLPNEVVGTGFDRPCGENGKGETDTEGQKWCVKNHQTDNHWNVCSPLDEEHPLTMGQELVVGIDISDLHETGINTNQIKLLNVNVSSQQSSPLNPSPIRPSFPGSAGGGGAGSTGSVGEASQTGNEGGWWTQLHNRPPGWDGEKIWQAYTEYQRGDVVADASRTRFFRANKKCFNSGPALLDPFPRQQSADWVRDGSVIWQEMYVDSRQSLAGVQPWKENTEYAAGTIVSVARGGPGPIRRSLLRIQEVLAAVSEQVSEPSTRGNKSINEIAAEIPLARCGVPVSNQREHTEYYWAVRRGKSGSIPKDPFSIILLPRAVYLPWPFQLPADVIPTLTVNVVYSPPSPGSPWQGNTFYPTGSIVTSSLNSGHYYSALIGGFSESEPHEPKFPVGAPPKIEDGDIEWLDSGPNAPNVASVAQPGAQGAGGSKAQLWVANTRYLIGDVIQNPENGHYYTMVRSIGGRSGTKDPFPLLPAAVVMVHDGDLLWQRTNDAPTKGEWKPSQDYQKNDIVTIDGSTFRLLASMAAQGKSSSSEFSQAASPGNSFVDGDVLWQDLGQDSRATPARQKNTVYGFGQQMSANGELYAMVGANGGISGRTKPNLPNAPGKPTAVADGDLIWIETGNMCPDPSWFSNQSYALTATVCSSDHHEYRLLRYTAGSSGPEPPKFPIFQTRTVLDVPGSPKTSNAWDDLGVIRPVGTPEGDITWDPVSDYPKDAVVYLEKPLPGHYYRCSLISCSGKVPGRLSVSAQDFAVFSYAPLTWEDLGTTPPPNVSSGQPADQTVNLLNTSLPQVHSLSYFNIAAGAVVTFKRAPTFGFVTAPNIPPTIKLPKAFGPAPGPVAVVNGAPVLSIEPTTGCTVVNGAKNADGTIPVTACPVKTGSGSYQFDPVLALTIYPIPVDAEVPFRWKRSDLIPGFSAAFSLANPTSNFFFGGSNEFAVRNVQVFYGLSLIKTGLQISPNQAVFGGSGTAPAVVTKQGFEKGFFTGFTFNLSNFIQSLGFGGSKGQSQ